MAVDAELQIKEFYINFFYRFGDITCQMKISQLFVELALCQLISMPHC